MIWLFEEIAYYINWPDRLIGLINRMVHRSEHGRFGPVFQIKFQRIDRGGELVSWEVAEHLERHGVVVLEKLYDSKYIYLLVRESQRNLAEWLFNDGVLRETKTRWME